MKKDFLKKNQQKNIQFPWVETNFYLVNHSDKII